MEYSMTLASKLVNISGMIINLYKQMAALEYGGKKDSFEYAELKRKAGALISSENEIYDELKEDIKTAYAINNFLFPTGILCLPDELEYIKRQDEDGLTRARVGRHINDIVLTAPFTEEEFESEYEEETEYTEEDYEDYEEIIGKAENPEEEFQKESELTIAVENDIINTILTMLTSYKDSPDYEDIKQGLTYIKYYLAFIFPDIEKMLLRSSFEAPPYLYWTSYFTGNMHAEPSENVKALIREYIMDIISNQLDAYYAVIDETEPDIRKINMTFTEIILRSSMIFFNDGEIRDIKELAADDIKELTNEPDINNSLNRVFRSREKDSSLPMVLSLEPKFPET